MFLRYRFLRESKANKFLRYYLTDECSITRRRLKRVEHRARHLGEFRARKQLVRTRLIEETTLGREIVDSVKRNGFAQSSLEALHISSPVLEYCEELARPYRSLSYDEVSTISRKKGGENTLTPYMLNLFEPDRQKTDPIRDLATHPVILQLAADYIDHVPVLGWICCFFTPPLGENINRMGPMNWHLDTHHPRIMKLFINPRELQMANGPTIVYPARYRGRKYWPHFPSYFPDDDAFKAGFNEQDQVPFTGPPGTIHFVDTGRCFHCGSRAGEGRLLLQIVYHTLDAYTSYLPPPQSAEAKLYKKENEKILSLFESKKGSLKKRTVA